MNDEARLIVLGDRVHAVYRGGPRGTRLLEADVTDGRWAGEVDEPRSHGSIDASEPYGIRADEDAVRVVR
jgi:hypothetical protein